MDIPAAQRHLPVMRDRIVHLLAPALTIPGSVYVDGTLGMGGHAEAILQTCPHARVIGIDRDPHALALAAQRLAPYGDRFLPVRARYDQIDEVVADAGLTGVQGVLLDLGVSSLQLDEADRGFAYRVDAPLDMRMDTDLPFTAADVLNTYDVADLARILSTYGEERWALKIAKAVAAERQREPFTQSARLVELLHRVIPAASRRTGGHPAKRTFQALRIEVNGELDSLAAALPAAVEVCATGGRVAVLSYHSLEDRMVKQVFAAGTSSSAPPDLPVELPEHAPYLHALTRGAEAPDDQEILDNSRAASAKLRVVQRIAPTPPGRRPTSPIGRSGGSAAHRNRGRKGRSR
ncbi:Ribosomal RNA small subunit methyltransferase H [Austwickia sp. TVS 96-490-7B]|uniref:16S rRNA (cytosine(1402)-N(4))-methyltransferase RsmH n=1 Tax=Austwickia sp. TVS 96-490-7B TaxID=2830843 RepID=UPI001C56BDB3|nr:16S rRNA (cytosine(1402)-N(4))-methyltransferase RsmH [Austwickia sp. TVS 96-490-7B]MBW3084411.1 Ribosomal RNA small subunit methyltransferase H [Austwickia sp. TVS 96-490-7B]